MGPLLGRLWSLRFYLLLLWIGFAGFSSAEGETPEIRAEMSPQDQVIAVNSTFVVNCTLNRTRPMYHWTSSDLFFALGGERLDDEYTTVLDEYTIQLRKPMREKLRSAFIVCYLRDHLSSSGKMLSVAQTTLTVGEPPVEPRITSCIVHNWTRMVCTFEPDNQLELTGLETTQTVYYSIKRIRMHRAALSDGGEKQRALAKSACPISG
ncbi:hypothetical protein CAPTEDRAFT_211007 [Capitella teleta]|uniref:Ig-like domain-containing protein n=1 Tax=Capitella teleta TaxID=283909 RepID=R7VE55_CAPTE|nr:hypothetical protein CAPTEDRAFT_211007 [Capitella teleta]|eukprot:ELU14581.1 hypothetical protein CAPTEDRAFT_211007 [Capitella teleta]